MAEPQGQAEAKNRVTQACVPCGVRKTKCDGAIPVCKSCETRNRDCFYAEPRRAKRQKTEGPNLQVSTPLQRRPASVPSTVERPLSEQPHQNVPARTSQIHMRPNITAYPPSSGGDLQYLPRPLTPSKQKSKNVVVSSDITARLIGVYFTTIHPVWPILYKPIYDTTDFNSLADSLPQCLKYAIYAIAALAYRQHDSSNAVPDSSLFFEASLLAVRRIGKSDRNDQNTHDPLRLLISSTESCQSLTLLALQQHAIGQSSNAYILCSQAAAMAIDLNLHRAMPAATDPTVVQVNSRLWWNLYILDKMIACELGRPILLRNDETNAEFPSSSESDEYQLLKSHVAKDGKILSSKAYTMSGFGHTVQLAMMMEKILRQVYSLGSREGIRLDPTAAEGVRSRLWQMVKDYIESVKSSRFDLDTYKNNQNMPPPVVVRNMVWVWTTVILLHRPFYHYMQQRHLAASTNPNALNLHPLEVCCSAAENIINDIDAHVEDISRLPCDLIFPVFTAASVLRHYSEHKHDSAPRNTKDRLEECMQLLGAFSQNRGHISNGKSQSNHTQGLKRASDDENSVITVETPLNRASYASQSTVDSARYSRDTTQIRPLQQQLEASAARYEWGFLDSLGDPADELYAMDDDFRHYLRTRHFSTEA